MLLPIRGSRWGFDLRLPYHIVSDCNDIYTVGKLWDSQLCNGILLRFQLYDAQNNYQRCITGNGLPTLTSRALWRQLETSLALALLHVES